jgi:antitoxin ParD1/3/4
LFNTDFFDKIKIFVNRKIMNIQIQPELEQIIEAQIATGRYANPEEVISKALNLLLQWEKGYQLWVAQTREKVDVAIEQLDRGEGIEGEVVIEQLRDKLRKAREIQG